MWAGNKEVFRGYVIGNPEGDGKAPLEKVKNRNLSKWEDVCESECFGAILNENYIDISFDTDELSSKFWEMAEKNNWNCLILENQKNGHIHSYWKDSKKKITKGGKDKKLAVGLIADIHNGSTYIPLRVHNIDRFPPCFEPEQIDEVPEELLPVNTQIDLLNLSEGDGRNDELFKYILILQSQLSISKDVIRRILTNTNTFIFSKPLKDSELETITRDEAFESPIFYNGKSFLHDAFGQYMKNEFHIKRINGQLHVYDEGIYKSGSRFLESKMVSVIPTLKSANRSEVLKYIDIITPEESYPADARYIAFRNGIYDIVEQTLLPSSPDLIITNQIPWDYNPSAYDELCDHTLNKLSCNDPDIRKLLEECIGFCFYRKNELSKSFFLTGSGANGKSTFLDVVRNVLGRQNYVSLDMDELSERFSTTTMFGKLANIGDDISDEFLQGKAISMFKKIVSGNDIKAENKGEDAYFFKPTVKLLFSANEIPRVRNRGFDAIKRRLVIIPFDAKFSKNDPDYDPDIVYKLKSQESAEYLIQLGLQGLERIRKAKDFTVCKKVQEEVDSYEKDNNPILLFLDEVPEEEILNHETKEVFTRYDLFCYQNGYSKMAMQSFTKAINKNLNCTSKQVRLNDKRYYIFKRGENDERL